MYKLLGRGFQDLPTFIGPNGEITLNIARSGIETIDTLPVNINVLILDHNYIRRLENLSTLCDLQQLSVADNKLLQMHGVAGLINLTILNLPNNGIVTMDGLAKLTNLRWLNLSGNKLKVIEQLDTNLNLKHLDLSDNYIYELQNLSHLRKLKTLLLHCNHISTLRDGSKNLPKSLEILSLASNMVSNILEVQELSCLPMLSQFSLGNNPCIESFANDYRLFVLGWLPNLRILDGTRITKEDIEKANCFISGIKSPLFIQSSSQSERSKSNEDTDKGILNRNTELITHEVVNYNLPINHHSRSISSCTRFSTELNQNFSCDDISPHSVSSISSKPCSGELMSAMNNSCSNEDRNHVFQSFSPSVIATTNSTPRNYPLNNTSMISSILNNGNIHLNQIKCNNKSTCTEGVNMSSLSYSSSPANLKLNINNINDNKSLFITHETSSYPMTNPQPLLKISTNSPRQVLPEIKEGLFKTKLIDDLCRMNSYCNDQLIISSNNLLSSDSVYLPLNVSNTTNNIEETFETGYKAKSHSNAVHCTISDVKDWQSIDKKSLKLSPSDSLLSSGNFIPLHQSMYPQSPKLSHSLNNSLHSINSNENIKFETLGFINGVHLIHDGEENEEGDNNDDNINEEEDDVITETTVQSSRFIEHIDKPNNDEQSKVDSTITLNNNNNIDEEDILVKGVLDDMDLTCLINLKHKISTQSLKVHNSITKDQENEIFDNNIKQQSVQSAEVNEDSKLAVNTDVNDDNHVESNSVATDRYNVTTTVLDNALINPITLNINKFSHNSNPVTLSSTSSMATSLSNYCPTCGNQTKLLQDHVIFLQKQLQNQCKSNEAESKLNQLHSNSIQFLLKEVQELKSWKESISLKLTNSIYKSIEFSSNYTQTDIQDHYYDQRNELIIENTLNNNVDLLNIKKSNDNNLNCIQLSNNIIEQNHMENANELKNNSNSHLLNIIVQFNGTKEEQNEKFSYELSKFNEYEEDKTLSSFAKMSNTELSKISEQHHTLHYDNRNFDKNENNNGIVLMNNILQRSSYGNTSKILGTHRDIESNTTVTDSYDLEDFSDLELVRQAALQAMNLDSTSIDASLHSSSSQSIVTSSIS
ncbi:unnamed protein product [Schistosoma margrebowiei]|uniref:Centrosomal protein of 97 kDa n=2 Tax=Schistosoma margrebowiei TaxID=48269 RepID=A0AA85AL64_9TREM|nr:unnamed protein product [Schistosoma margrebowiei]